MESRTGFTPMDERSKGSFTPPHGDPVMRSKPASREGAWAMQGAIAGLTGAAVVALYFLVIDLMAGRPLWTPTALGSQLLIGEPHAADAAFSATLVAAYTLVHGLVFLGIGMVAAIAAGAREASGWRGTLGIGAAIFVGVEVFFLAVASVFAPGLISTVGAGQVTVANALAAISMAVVLTRTSPGDPRTGAGD